MRTTKNLYHPVNLEIVEKTDEDKKEIAANVFLKLGFSFGTTAMQSKIGRLLSVLIDDAIKYILSEYPGVPNGAIAEVITARMLKTDVKERMQKIVDMYHDGQQDMLKELGEGKIADKWSRIAERDRQEQAEDKFAEIPQEVKEYIELVEQGLIKDDGTLTDDVPEEEDEEAEADEVPEEFGLPDSSDPDEVPEDKEQKVDPSFEVIPEAASLTEDDFQKKR